MFLAILPYVTKIWTNICSCFVICLTIYISHLFLHFVFDRVCLSMNITYLLTYLVRYVNRKSRMWRFDPRDLRSIISNVIDQSISSETLMISDNVWQKNNGSCLTWAAIINSEAQTTFLTLRTLSPRTYHNIAWIFTACFRRNRPVPTKITINDSITTTHQTK